MRNIKQFGHDPNIGLSPNLGLLPFALLLLLLLLLYGTKLQITEGTGPLSMVGQFLQVTITRAFLKLWFLFWGKEGKGIPLSLYMTNFF